MIIALPLCTGRNMQRLTRSIAIAFKQSECVSAARMCGARAGALMMRYFVPEMAGQVAVLSAVSMSDIVLTMAGLSFVGLGPARPTNEWGAMMSEAQAHVPVCAMVHAGAYGGAVYNCCSFQFTWRYLA